MINVIRSERHHRTGGHRPNLLSSLWEWLFARRHRTVAIERLSEHLLRDIGVRRRYQHRRDQQFR